MSIGAHLTPNNSLHPSLSNSTGLAVGPGARRYQVFGNGIPTGLIGGPGPGPGPAGGQSWGGPAMVPGLGVGPGGPFAMIPAIGGGMDDDVIPTAIVIKNINFNLQKEDLLRTIESLGAPLPYAFNYHMDQGVFRGLAFANFRSAHEADAVVAALNGYDVGGRKLRVEYKKVLQAGEKERIEREKALRRMRSIQQPQGTSSDNHHQQQQQQQSRPSTGSMPSVSTPVDEYPGIQPVSLGLGLGASVSPNGGHAQYSQHQQQQAGSQLLHRERSGSGEAQGMNGLGIPTVQVTAQRDSESGFYSQQEMDDVGAGSDSGESSDSKSTELDLNDPITLDIYSRILVFKEDRMRDELAFSRTLSALQRRVVHLVAQKLGVYHYSVGEGDKRYAVVTRSEGRVGGSGDRTLRHHTSRPNLPTHQTNHNSHNHQGHHQQQHLQANQNLYASSPSLRSKSSMPDLSHLHGPAVSRDPTRAIAPQRSSSNLRDGYSLMGSISNGIGGRTGVSSVHPRRSTTNPIDHGFLNPQMNIPSYHGTLLKQASESTESLLSSDGMSASVGQLGSSSSSSNGGGGGGGMSQSMAALLRQPRAPGGGQNSGGFGVFRRFGMPGSVEKHQLSGETAFNTTQEPLEL
ncbi:mRNA cleavage and polyadenylation factor I complex, subunit RNA15 [Phaffia rhodozyma]|uniref:mRNA cleavage and polyadenylation factor I complex, subunit RNA15 n=1 Tax=Phaffia rhodozyma TaxID=264483 RepID=A0A0F7SJN8_PHARH|nr:mRNA cleavage and polyadenylation factor I complex, subunit RNA15 [Phaffia rhodozyma]